MFICAVLERFVNNGSGGIRTPEGDANRFTVCPRCPLEYTPDNTVILTGFEPVFSP